MSKVIDRRYMALGILLGVFLVFIITACSFAIKTQNESEDNWVIQSLDDTVVLLNNGEVVEVFSNIVVDTLPNEDKMHLEKGISFLTKDEALTAIEDYDG